MQRHLLLALRVVENQAVASRRVKHPGARCFLSARFGDVGGLLPVGSGPDRAAHVSLLELHPNSRPFLGNEEPPMLRGSAEGQAGKSPVGFLPFEHRRNVELQPTTALWIAVACDKAAVLAIPLAVDLPSQACDGLLHHDLDRVSSSRCAGAGTPDDS